MGIEHALLPGQGFVAPGESIIGADSCTCTYGALGAFSTGIGSTDIAVGMYTGRNWFKVPAAIRVNLTGQFTEYVGGKDLILSLIGMIGVDGARYKNIEFTGEEISGISIDDRFIICNMAIKAGAKNAIFPVDEVRAEVFGGTGGPALCSSGARPECQLCVYHRHEPVPALAGGGRTPPALQRKTCETAYRAASGSGGDRMLYQ